MNNIILIGFMASGKTTVGKLLSKKLCMDLFDTDYCIEENEKLSIKCIFEKYGEEYFRKVETSILKSLFNKKNAVISTGGGVIKSKENIRLLKKMGIIVFLDTSQKEIKKRLKISKIRPLNKNDKFIENLYKKRYKSYFCSADIVIKSNTSIEAFEKIICQLNRKKTDE